MPSTSTSQVNSAFSSLRDTPPHHVCLSCLIGAISKHPEGSKVTHVPVPVQVVDALIAQDARKSSLAYTLYILNLPMPRVTHHSGLVSAKVDLHAGASGHMPDFLQRKATRPVGYAYIPLEPGQTVQVSACCGDVRHGVHAIDLNACMCVCWAPYVLASNRRLVLRALQFAL